MDRDVYDLGILHIIMTTLNLRLLKMIPHCKGKLNYNAILEH